MNSQKWMFLAVISFCLLAISVKEIESEINSFQIIFFRSFIGLVSLSVYSFGQIKKIKPQTIKKHLSRNIFHLLGQYGWILGILYLSISEVTAIEFTVPIWVIMIAALFLKEKLTRTKVLALSLGFIGVLVILRPGIEIVSINSIIVLASAISYSITHIITKTIIKSSTAFEIVFIMCLLQTPISFCFALTDWKFPTNSDYIWLILISVSAITAHFSMARAFKEDKISDLIIIDYLRLPILILFGIFLYNEDLSIALVIGAFLILFGNFLNYKHSI